jgi:RND family efflux transporter MFP subunit
MHLRMTSLAVRSSGIYVKSHVAVTRCSALAEKQSDTETPSPGALSVKPQPTAPKEPPSTTLKHRAAFFVGTGFAAVIALLALWWFGRLPRIEVLTIVPTTVERVLAVVGRARPTDLLDVRSPNGGQVIRILHGDGDVVAAGQPLAVIRATIEQAQTKAAIARERAARVEATRAKLAFDRTLSLANQGFVSIAALDDARAALQSAEANVSAAGAATVVAREHAREFTVRSPIAGIVLFRPIDNGQVVSANTTLFELGSRHGVEIRAEVDEAYADTLRPGMAARAVLSGTETRFAAQVTEVSPKVDSATGGRLVKLIPLGPSPIAPGRSVDVTIVVDRKANSIVIPWQTVVDATTSPKVFIVDLGDVVRARKVEIARWPSANAIILKGLAAGDRVILTPTRTKPSARVHPVAATSRTGD